MVIELVDIMLIIISTQCQSIDYTWYYGLGESMEQYYGIEYGIQCHPSYYDYPHNYAKYHAFIFIDQKPPIDLKGNWGWCDYGRHTFYMVWQDSYDKLNSWIITHEMMHLTLFDQGYDRDAVDRMLMHSFQPESKYEHYFYHNNGFIGYILYKLAP